jgi:cell division protein FtsW
MVPNMGEGAYVTPTRPLQPGHGKYAAQAHRPLHLTIDVPLLLIVLTLVVFGLLMVFSASWDASLSIGDDPTYIFRRQLLWVAVGAVACITLSFINYHSLRRLLLPMVLGTLALLVVVLWVSDERFGATRSIFGGSIQPSELAKVVTVLYVSFWLYNHRESLGSFQLGLLPLGAILGILGGLILMQPDLSATFTIFFLGFLLFFLAGGEWKHLVLLIVIGALLAWLVIKIYPTGNARLTSYLAGIQDPIQASYHVRRSLEAVVQGGFFGVGIGQASTKFIGLPVPATDSIFAVIAEETGLLGAAFLVALYLGLLWRGLTIARRATDQLGALLASGLTLWLVAEAMINMTVIVGLLPVSGNALPFISAGGSNLVTSLASIGIIMNVSRTSRKREIDEGRSLSAVVDMRRRDGGRRVPRSVRPSNTRQ